MSTPIIYGDYTSKKDDEYAIDMREKGNIMFKAKKFVKALMLYNVSIAYAKTKNVVALSYGNRSAVFFECKMYKECLMNINWAKQNGYPISKVAKLNQRAEKCKKLMVEKIDKTWDFFKLSYEAHDKYPWMIHSIDLRYVNGYGHEIYTTRDLKAGDIISIEVPFLHFQSGNMYYRRCFNCFKKCMMNLVPCRRIAMPMFCSEDCKEQLYSKASNIDKDISIMIPDDGRMYTELANLVGDKELSRFAKSNPQNLKRTIFDYDFSDPNDPNRSENQVSCFLSLPYKYYSMLKVNPSHSLLRQTHLRSLTDVLGNINARNRLNCSMVDKNMVEFPDGAVIGLFTSLIRKCCIGNVSFILVEDKIVTYVKRPIKAGEAICFSRNSYDARPTFFLNGGQAESPWCCRCKSCKKEVILDFKDCDFMIRNVIPWSNKLEPMDYDQILMLYKNVCHVVNDPKTDFEKQSRFAIGLEMAFHRIVEMYTLPYPNDGDGIDDLEKYAGKLF